MFDFDNVLETSADSIGRDVITDFVRRADKIDLSTIDADAAAAGNNAFTGFIGATASFTQAGQLQFRDGVLYGNIDNDAVAEFSLQLTGITALAVTDIVL